MIVRAPRRLMPAARDVTMNSSRATHHGLRRSRQAPILQRMNKISSAPTFKPAARSCRTTTWLRPRTGPIAGRDRCRCACRRRVHPVTRATARGRSRKSGVRHAPRSRRSQPTRAVGGRQSAGQSFQFHFGSHPDRAHPAPRRRVLARPGHRHRRAEAAPPARRSPRIVDGRRTDAIFCTCTAGRR